MSSKLSSLRCNINHQLYYEGKKFNGRGSADQFFQNNRILLIISALIIVDIFLISLLITNDWRKAYNIIKIVFEVAGGIGGIYVLLQVIKG